MKNNYRTSYSYNNGKCTVHGNQPYFNMIQFSTELFWRLNGPNEISVVYVVLSMRTLLKTMDLHKVSLLQRVPKGLPLAIMVFFLEQKLV